MHPDDRERVLQGIHAVIDSDQQDWSDEYLFQRADGSYAEVLDRGFVMRDADGKPVRVELINYDRHGGTYWLELDITPIAGADGRLTHFVAVERDITEYKRIETAMRESEQRFRIAAKVSTDAIWDWNLLTGALWWSEGLQTLFGHALADIEPGIESWTRRVHPDDRERVLQGIHAVIDSDQQDWSEEYLFQRADGSYAEVLDRG